MLKCDHLFSIYFIAEWFSVCCEVIYYNKNSMKIYERKVFSACGKHHTDSCHKILFKWLNSDRGVQYLWWGRVGGGSLAWRVRGATSLQGSSGITQLLILRRRWRETSAKGWWGNKEKLFTQSSLTIKNVFEVTLCSCLLAHFSSFK